MSMGWKRANPLGQLFFVYPDNGITYCFGISLRHSLSKAVKGGELNFRQNSYPPSAFSVALHIFRSLLSRVVVFADDPHLRL